MSVLHTGRQPEDWTSGATHSASPALVESFHRSWAGLAHVSGIESLAGMDRPLPDGTRPDASVALFLPRCRQLPGGLLLADHVGHILPNEGALGAWVEEALYEHTLAIHAKGTRPHALEADLLSATVCGQHAAPRPGWLGCLVPGRRLRTVQKLVVTTPTSRHCALPPYFTSLHPMATLQATETQLVPCCHA
ncbi:hypothetical protein T03_6276 [Trichinella britovi]|uniref:Uncharacterized protein n=1 Tax=Trichinella britovi TaxID=45882 RepID=A0A0V1C430_TRIBR|nr:hypothetical protein T09_13694 [Trichinella sp. T9]KRY44005.1 hypothetical protein T03_998 [Trichinella britovi]KRY48388.1 hypothetical protein T03_6276 [Trichinella britovi]KRZ81918.1 hypothetical protein T08_13225 [Trichinella sp. T8]